MKNPLISKLFIEKQIDSGKTLKTIAVELNVGITTLKNYCKAYGIVKSSRIYREDYFDQIDSQNKAYWLGLLTADGSVTKNKYGDPCNMEITLQKRDQYLLEQLRDEVCPRNKVSDRKSTCSVRLTMSNRKICESLIRLGVVPNKTYVTDNSYEDVLNVIPKDFHRHFIRGFFDGDGGWFVSTYMAKRGIVKRIGGIMIANSKLRFLQNLCSHFTFMNSNFRFVKRSEFNHVLCIPVNRRNVQNIYNYFYKDSNRFLKRKEIAIRNYIADQVNMKKPASFYCRKKS